MSNIGMSCDKANRKIFLIAAKREEEILKKVIFNKFDDVPKGETLFLFDHSEFWIVCEITCCSEKTFDCMCQCIKDCMQ